MSKTFKELQLDVLIWAKDKGILDKGNPMSQAIKTMEECTELLAAIDAKDDVEIVDALGDILVTIIIQSQMQDLSLLDCLESAYNVISEREGEMVNGVFVKQVST